MPARLKTWTAALDFAQAARNIEVESVADWHRDPWGWPEVSYLIKRNTSRLFDLTLSTGARRVALIDVPKENWGTRPAVVLDIVDRLVYQALVDRLSPDLIGDLPPTVFGWRLPPTGYERGKYSKNSLQWAAYRSHMATSELFSTAALKSDITSFFASIEMEHVHGAIDDRAPAGAVTERLHELLRRFSSLPHRSGLPQRSTPSAVLANMLMQPVDDLLQSYALEIPKLFVGKTGATSRKGAARWMDDIWLFGDDVAKLRKAQVNLQSVARSLGLEVNTAKTDVLVGADVREQALQIEHSAVDNALERTPSDSKPLEEMINEILADPERCPRTSAKFAVRRLISMNLSYRTDDFMQAACRMPHLADVVAELFSSRAPSSERQDWLLSYSAGEWVTFDWSLAHYVAGLPGSRKPRKAIRDLVASKVAAASTSLPLLAASVTQLVLWDASLARSVIQAALESTSNPHHRRALAIAALECGEGRTRVRRWLAQEPENSVTLEMLEDANFSPPSRRKSSR